MGKVIFTISYEVKPERREEYLALSQEMKSYITGTAGRNYTIYEQKGKKNHFSEVFLFNSLEEYDQLEDEDEQMSALVGRLESLLTNGKMKYSTLLELVQLFVRVSRPRKPTDPIAQLMQEHDDALLQLKLLNKAVRAFSTDGYSSSHFRQIKAALRFIREEVTVHNHMEEAALFPVLERYVEGPTRIMRNDHKLLRRGFGELRAAVGRIERNRDSFSAIKRLSGVSQRVVHLFVNHIHKENYILFPLVQKFLTAEELREVARKMV